MNIQEAIKSGKNFYRKSKPQVTYYSPLRDLHKHKFSYHFEDVMADDYEIIEEKRLFTKKDFEKIFKEYQHSPLEGDSFLAYEWSKYGQEYK